MHNRLSRMPLPSKNLAIIFFHFCFLFTLLLMLCGISFESSGHKDNFLPLQYMKRTEESMLQASLPAHEVTDLLLNLPRAPATLSLVLTNYAEDTAIREAILAQTIQWHLHVQMVQSSFRASNAFTVSLDAAHPLPFIPQNRAKGPPQPEGTLLTARILLGLWASRRHDPLLSLNDQTIIHPDEILSWRGIQKHHRQAYYGSRKQFSDGYPWKQRQQVQQDLTLLSRLQLRGQHVIRTQGRIHSVDVDAPYILFTPIEKQGKIAAYLVSPGDWIASYEQHQLNFLASVRRELFHLNPRNDYLALRLGFYLVEYWRRHAHTDKAQKPVCMAHLLTASMIPIEKANLTSRFVPRVEAALQKLYTIGLLKEPPHNLSVVDTTKAHWGKDWLASLWQLVPSQE